MILCEKKLMFIRRSPLLFDLIACLAFAVSLRGGGFKRFYEINSGEQIVSLTALPGDSLLLKSRPKHGGREINRVFVPAQQKVFLIPDGLTPLAAAAESGILLQKNEKLFFWSLMKPAIWLEYTDQNEFKFIDSFQHNSLVLKYSDDIRTSFQAPLLATGIGEKYMCQVAFLSDTCAIKYAIDITYSNSFSVSQKGDFVYQYADREKNYLEPAETGKSLIEWGQTSQIGWVVISTLRYGSHALPERKVELFSATQGRLLAKTKIAPASPEKGLAVTFRMRPASQIPSEVGSDALVVITGTDLQWWAPKANNLDNWEVITLDPSTAKPLSLQ